jgi:hypothetical protein
LRWRDVVTAERERTDEKWCTIMLIGFVDVELQSVIAFPQRDVGNAVDETLQTCDSVPRSLGHATKAAALAVVGVEMWRKSVPLDDRLYRSTVYSTNRIGLRTDPRGMPHSSSVDWEVRPPGRTVFLPHRSRPVRQEDSQECAQSVGLISNDRRRDIDAL